ncbi:MAG: tetratricopeptide repeat protein, partial [Myxococcales bacterium]|nr:tetratricopeptide repeat protein [Myxococcales bacterium]
PDNAMIDEHGRVRVMDFGLAAIADEGPQSGEPEPSASHVDLTGIENLSVDRSTSSGLLSAQLTEVGRLIGTPAFMAPEQLAGRRGGPAADQFALCVSTWQTLTGERPYPGDDVEALLAAMHAGKLRTPGAAMPKGLRRVLERGLATEPEQRWPSMAALAEALEAVQRGSSRMKLLTFGAAVVLLATAAVGGGLWSRHSQNQRCAAVDDGWSEAQRDAIAEAMTRAGDHGSALWVRAEPLLETWSAAHRSVTASACREDDGLPPALRVAQAVCLDRQRRALAETLELLRTADAATAARALDMVGELPDPSHCADAEHLAALDRRTPPRDAEGAAAVNDAIFRGRALLQAGRHRDAVAVLDPLRATASELDAPAVEGELQATLGEAELALGLSPRATASLGLAYASLLRAGEDQAAAAVAVLLISAEADQAHGELARLWDLHAEALIARAGDGAADTRPLQAQRLTAMAVLADGEGDYALARQRFEEAAAMQAELHGEDSREHARILRQLAAVHGRQGSLEQARETAEHSRELLAKALGPAHPELGHVHAELGNIAYRQGDLAEAGRQFEQAIAIVEPVLGSDHQVVTSARTGLGAVALGLGESEQAAASFQAALDGIEHRVGDAHPDLVPPLVNLGIAQKRAMQLAEAEATQRRAVALLEQLYGPDHPHLQAALDNLGEVLALRGDHQAAVDAYQRSLKIGELRFGPTHPELDYALIGLAESALALGDLEQARRAFTRVTRDPEAEGKQQDLVAVGYFGEARLLAAEGKAQPARERAGEARALMAAQPRPDAGELKRIDAWLAAH